MQKSKINMEILNQEELDGLMSKAHSYAAHLKNTMKAIQKFEYEIDVDEVESSGKLKKILMGLTTLGLVIGGVVAYKKKKTIKGYWIDGPTLHFGVDKK